MSDSIKQNYVFSNGATAVAPRLATAIVPNLPIAPRTEQTRSVSVFVEPQVKYLLKNLLLSGLTDDAFVRLLPFMESVALAKNEAIYQSGEDINYVYFPESALVSEFQILEDGRTVEISLVGRDGAVGVVQAINSQRAKTWTQACLAGSAIRIDAKIFRQEIGRNLSLQSAMFGYMHDYFAQLAQRVVCHRYHLVEERLCTWLLTLNDHKKSGELPVTQEEIARLLGVHRPSVTHIAQTLRDKGAIDYLRGKIIVLDRRQLENSACSCYADK